MKSLNSVIHSINNTTLLLHGKNVHYLEQMENDWWTVTSHSSSLTDDDEKREILVAT